MKKYVSVMMLVIRQMIYPLLLLTLLMGAVQTILFIGPMNRETALEGALKAAWLPWVFGAGFLTLCVLLIKNGCEYGSSAVRYTLKRLSLREPLITVLWAICNSLGFVLFWLSEVLVVLVLCQLYVELGQAAHAGPQTVFLAFYRSGFLSALFPLSGIGVIVRNLIFCLALGTGTACVSHRMRKRDI